MSDLAQAVHALGDSGGRSRLEQRDGTYQLSKQRRWYCTTVSTGEARIEDLFGSDQQGGHAVRLLDLWISREDMTHSRDHTRSLRRAIQLNHGVAARHWVEALTRVDWDELHERVGKIGEALSSPFDETAGEARRVVDIIALVIVALAVANECHLVPWGPEERRELAAWAVERIVAERLRRRTHDPNFRMLKAFLRAIDEEEARAPFIDGRSLSARTRGLLAIRERGPGDEDYVSTSVQWLESSGLCGRVGVTAEEWLRWAKDEGVVVRHTRVRKGGYRQWYWTLDLEIAQDKAGFGEVSRRPGAVPEGRDGLEVDTMRH